MNNHTEVLIVAGDELDDNEVVVARSAPQLTVQVAPKNSRISLGVLQESDPELLFISGRDLYLGNDPDGREVVYRVIGWDDDSCSLLIERKSQIGRAHV